MHLSPVYNRREKWIMVYHTDWMSEEVEMVEEKFFDSEKDAWAWFHDNHKVHHFIQPEVVKASLGKMVLTRQE